jgi:hyperosmotically inducible periplasmic protein
MKLSRNLSAAALCVMLGASLVSVGCSSTPTSASTGQQIDDTTITTKVKAKMVDDPAVSALNIKVETFKGTVQLSGFANNATEVNRAVAIARGTDGVQSVKNDIRLKTSQ